MPPVAVITQVYNEARSIRVVIEQVRACGGAEEIIVVDDGFDR
jgi:glycosyltransferase involved in cell wall biosynthesis